METTQLVTEGWTGGGIRETGPDRLTTPGRSLTCQTALRGNIPPDESAEMILSHSGEPEEL